MCDGTKIPDYPYMTGALQNREFWTLHHLRESRNAIDRVIRLLEKKVPTRPDVTTEPKGENHVAV